jgi:hypothetical protein
MTNGINVILHNFMDYYGKLYVHKKLCPLILDKLIKNLTLNLTKEKTAALGGEISPEEVLNAIMAIVSNKSPHMNRLTYECYIESPYEAA